VTACARALVDSFVIAAKYRIAGDAIEQRHVIAEINGNGELIAIAQLPGGEHRRSVDGERSDAATTR